MSKVAKLFGISTPKQDPELARMQQEQAQRAEKEETNLKKQQDAKIRAMRGKGSGFRSLLSGLDTGVLESDSNSRSTLG